MGEHLLPEEEDIILPDSTNDTPQQEQEPAEFFNIESNISWIVNGISSTVSYSISWIASSARNLTYSEET